MFTIQPIRFVICDEELRTICICTETYHTWACVFQDKVFIFKLFSIDGFATSAIVVGEVTSLAHELRDDSVETATPEVLCKNKQIHATNFLSGIFLGLMCLQDRHSFLHLETWQNIIKHSLLIT
uniref:Uncharacterized protein n=1 Tax=Periophthalmus magnuspinnatus TaxID=409849 RepID=A0A3B4A1P8_9GOBI